MTDAAVVRPSGWTVLRGIRWTRALGGLIVLFVAALFIQPPVQSAPAVPAKADPQLYAQADAHPAQTFPVIVREEVPSSSTAEDLVARLGGHVTRELSIVGGFAAPVPGLAVPA